MSHADTSHTGEWRIAVKGEQRGPYRLDQIRAMIAEGRLPADTLVWRPGMANWAPLSGVPELSVSFAHAAPLGGTAASVAATAPSFAAVSPGTTPLADFLAFRTMLTPVLIKVVFWLGVVLCLLAGVADMIIGLMADSIRGIVLGLVVAVLGPILVRVYCELLIVFFQIHATLKEIRDQRK